MISKADKKLKIIFLAIIGVILLSFFLYSPVIFQEGNPIPLLNGAIRLSVGSQDIVKLDHSEGRYLTKSKNDKDILVKMLEGDGYRFIEQLGSGYVFRSDNFDILTVTRRQYSRFYSIWTMGDPVNIRDTIGWVDYDNEGYGFSFRYPLMAIHNKWWGNLAEQDNFLDLLLPLQVLRKDNNFYLSQRYDVEIDWQTGELIKTDNTFIPEYKENDRSYPLPWHIVIFDVEDEARLDSVIKQKLGSGCRYKSKIATDFPDNYRVEIDGDGKDLGETLCPVNYANYIIYSPLLKRVAFWSVGQECNIGLGFMSDNCFDGEISDSFHFLVNVNQETL